MANLEAMTGGGSNSCMSSGELRIDKASESSISTSGSLSSADISVKSSLSSCITGTSSVKSSSVSGKMSDSAISDTKASRKTGEIVDSVKTSLSRVSSSSSTVSDSNESICSSFSSGHKPHKGKDRRWESVLAAQMKDGALGLSHFRLLKRLGCGDIGSVYLCELRATDSYFAMKVMDKCALASRKKLLRVQTEREILQMLDHPFLPTLYAHFETDKFSCLVMEFCPGGDLHVLRQRQAGKYFPEHVARFYAAEVLLALEYLHMMGIVYRDLKPENVLVREDGHVMLSDFDLSLRCVVNPMLVKSSFSEMDPSKRAMVYCAQPACLEPTCIPPPCVAPACFVSKLLPSKPKKVQKPKNIVDNRVPELIAEPTGAQSMSFVGTHEYLAPEIIKGEGHGSAVDWWTFGIFLYELLHGRTPFKGDANRATLLNVIGQPLRFPQAPSVSYGARDLIRGLLVKDPQHRLAYKRGATEIKQHPFFEGINWALIRSMRPPEIPRRFDLELARSQSAHQHGSVGKNQDDGSSMPYLDFEFF